MKKVKLRLHYHCSYEKGVFGWNIFATVVAKQKAFIDSDKYLGNKISSDFIRGMSIKEQEIAHFLSLYYNENFEQRYTNIHKTCLIKEIRTLVD